MSNIISRVATGYIQGNGDFKEAAHLLEGDGLYFRVFLSEQASFGQSFTFSTNVIEDVILGERAIGSGTPTQISPNLYSVSLSTLNLTKGYYDILVRARADEATEGTENFSLTVGDKTTTVPLIDISNSDGPRVILKPLSQNYWGVNQYTRGYIVEGDSLLVTVFAPLHDAPAFPSDSNYYSISGIQSNDLGQPLAGLIGGALSGTGGRTTTIQITEDDYVESEILTLLIAKPRYETVTGVIGPDGVRAYASISIIDRDKTVTTDTTAPVVSTFSPSDGANSVSVGSNITVTFSEAIQRGSGTIEIRSGSANGALVESFAAATSNRLTFSGSILIIDPTSDLANGTQYFVTFASGSVRDLAGNNYADTSTYDFATEKNNIAPSFSIGPTGDGVVTTSGRGSFFGRDVALQADGKILVAGYSWPNANNSDFALVRYNNDGSVDTNFGVGGRVTTKLGFGGQFNSDYGENLAIQADGRILVAGSSYDGQQDNFALVRYNSDGSLDTNLDSDGIVSTAISNGSHHGKSVVLQPDGKIIVAGGLGDFALVRYNSNGSLDSSFDIDGRVTTTFGTPHAWGHSVAIQPDGKILVAGSSYDGLRSNYALVRYNSNGSLDTSFDGDGKVLSLIANGYSFAENFDYARYSVAIQNDGKILVAGSLRVGVNSNFLLIRHNADGSLDTSFGVGGVMSTDISGKVDMGYSVAIQADGKILVSGISENVGVYDVALVRYNSSGSLDTTFGGDGSITTSLGSSHDYGYSVAIQPDGKILVAGSSHDGSKHVFALVRYNSDGSLDYSFGGANQPDTFPVFTENSTPVVLDQDVTIYDTDLAVVGNYAGSSITIQRLGSASDQDHFSAAGSVLHLLEGHTFSVSNTWVGTVTRNGGGILTLTFNSEATHALVNSTLQGIAYGNVSEAPPENVTLQWTFSDGNTDAQGIGGALTATGSTTVYISPTNDAPVLSTGAPSLANVSVRQTNPIGQSVASFLGNSLSDPDGLSPQGIAIHASSGGAGRWQYRLNGQDEWTEIGSVSNADALLLSTTDFVRFLSDGSAATQASVSYYGWDQSSGAAGGRIDASNRGGTTAFSTASNTATLNVFDAVISSSSYTLKADEYDLELTGSSAINGTGNALDNLITGNAGNNILSGMAGDDVLIGRAGKDTLDGGLGEDTADYSDQTADVSIALGGRTPWISVRIGNQVEDRLKNIEHLIGGSGNDSLAGDAKANRLYGGLGNDSLDGGAGADTLVGGAGDDTYTIDNAGDVIIESSGEGTDLIRTTLRQIDLIDHDHVENLTYIGRGTTFLFGSDLDNVIKGGSGADGIWGGFGSDTLYGGDGADLLMGFFDNYGSDASYGVDIDARIAAERLISPDVLYGGKGNDIYIAGDEVNEQRIVELKNEGTDIIFGSYTEYVLSENVENYCNVMIQMDVSAPYFEIFGNSLNNVIQSSPDWSLMPAFADHNAELQWTFKNLNTTKFLSTVNTNPQIAIERFFGMAGNDTLLGGAGDDYLSGGEGRDRLTGGAGSDQFVFDAALNRSTNVDTITDFVRGQDKIVLDNEIFSKFTAGEDISDHFSATGRALDSDDYLIYSASNKTLFYDADGNGSGAAIAFAVLTGVNTLSHQDFLVM